MRVRTYLFYLLLILLQPFFLVNAQSNQNLPVFRFDFGEGKPAKGMIRITPKTVYNEKPGYGFDEVSGLQAVAGKLEDKGTGDYIAGSDPLFFSVKLPEGNYHVKLLVKENSEMIVRAECRRMMTEKIVTAGDTEISFLVNVRDSMIKGTNRNVKLKPREHDYLHWDDRLTLEFNGKNPKIASLEIVPQPDAITVFLAGNSTVVDQAYEPYAAWGQIIPAFFKPGRVSVANLAESGESLRSFRSEGRLDKVMSMMKAGDYLLIEFAHNDQKQSGPGIGAFTSYKKDLKYFIEEARKKGGIPVLVTSMHRRNFDSAGNIVNTLGDYPEAMRQAAKEENVPLIDLNQKSKVLYEAWGVEGSLKAFVHYPAGTYPDQVTELKDNTHFSPYGAYELAKCVLMGIKETIPELARHLKDIPDFNPTSPDPVSSFYWPSGKRISAAKPDGN